VNKKSTYGIAEIAGNMDGKTGQIHASVKVDLVTTFSPPVELRPFDVELIADEIHVWFGALDQPEPEYSRFMRTLSSDERTRAGRYHKQEDRNRFIARHGMLRMILGCYLGVQPGELRLHHGKHGKPELSGSFGKGTVLFNLSHSKDVALFAFSRNHELGVDIERIRDIAEMETIVERFFSAREKSFIRALPLDKRRDAFFYCWTRKEAYIKATGEGFSRPLDTVDVAPVQGGETAAIEGMEKETSPWSIRTLGLAREHASALVVNSKNCTLRCFKWAASPCD
jgi:4'-phosphopantetheinyl transferase